MLAVGGVWSSVERDSIVMIQNMLTRRKESNTYLATVSRHRWSRQITMKIDKI